MPEVILESCCTLLNTHPNLLTMPDQFSPIQSTRLTLHPVQQHQLAELRALSIRTFTDAFAEANTQKDMEIYLSQAFSEQQLLAEWQDSNASFLLLQSEGKTLGYCKIKYGLPSAVDESGSALEICRLYVSQAYQGQGLGQWMLDQILQVAEEEKLDFVWLGVWSRNPGAIRLYERHGFQQIGSYTFILGEDPQTDFIMKRSLV
jgi:ribosomal protein S18 acetylase RimI-like enzyme